MLIVIFFVVSLTVWGFTSHFLIHVRWQDWMVKHTREMPWLVIPGLIFSLISLFGPIYAAIWTFRLLSRATKHLEALFISQPPGVAASPNT